MKSNVKQVRIHIQVPELTKRRLQQLARRRGQTLSKLVAQIFEEHLETSLEQELDDIEQRIDRLVELKCNIERPKT